MRKQKTLLGTTIPKTTRGILYICKYERFTPKIEVRAEKLYNIAFEALNAYAEIPNPESQLVMGKTFEELILNLEILHNNMKDEKWLKLLGCAL
jgi:hypothetical protein